MPFPTMSLSITSPRVVVCWWVMHAEAEHCTTWEAEGRLWPQFERERNYDG